MISLYVARKYNDFQKNIDIFLLICFHKHPKMISSLGSGSFFLISLHLPLPHSLLSTESLPMVIFSSSIDADSGHQPSEVAELQ